MPSGIENKYAHDSTHVANEASRGNIALGDELESKVSVLSSTNPPASLAAPSLAVDPPAPRPVLLLSSPLVQAQSSASNPGVLPGVPEPPPPHDGPAIPPGLIDVAQNPGAPPAPGAAPLFPPNGYQYTQGEYGMEIHVYSRGWTHYVLSEYGDRMPSWLRFAVWEVNRHVRWYPLVPTLRSYILRFAPQAAEVKVQTEEEVKTETRVRNITAAIRERGVAALMTRELRTNSYRHPALRSMFAVASSEALREHTRLEVSDIVVSQYVRAVDDTIRLRTAAAEAIVLDTTAGAWWRSWIRGQYAGFSSRGSGYLHQLWTPLDRLEHLETLEPHSRIGVRGWNEWARYTLGFATWTFIMAYLEEWFKRSLFTTLIPLVAPGAITYTTAMWLGGIWFAHFESQIGGMLGQRLILHTYWTVYYRERRLWRAALSHTMWNLFVMFYDGWCGRPMSLFLLLGIQQPQLAHYSDYMFLDVKADTCLCARRIKPVQVCPEFKMSVNHSRKTCEPRFGMRRHFSVEGFEPIVHRNCEHNELVGLRARVGKVTPFNVSRDAEEAVFARWSELTRTTGAVVIGKLGRVIRASSFRAMLHSFPPAKRLKFVKIKDEGAVVPKTKKAKSFIKRETALVDMDHYHHRVFKDPRIIQGCPEEMTVVDGPWVRALAKRVRARLGPEIMLTPGGVRAGRQVIYTSGMSGEDIGTAFYDALQCLHQMCGLDDQVIVVEDDQSRFDLHMGRGPFHYLNTVYSAVLPRRIARDLRRTPRSSGRTSLGTRYTIPYTMQSGWPDTSVGDTLVNAVMKYDIHGHGRPWVSIICGDDSVTVTLRSELLRLGGVVGIRQRYLDFGMEVEAHERKNVFDVEFCSGRFLPTRDSMVLVPKTGKFIGKGGWDMTDRPLTERGDWLRSIVATLHQFGFYDPLLAALASGLRQSVGYGRALKSYNTFDKYVDGSQVPGRAELEDYYEHHYRMSPGQIDECVTYLKTVRLGTTIKHPLLQQMCAIDAS